jgi:hypothetical protein
MASRAIVLQQKTQRPVQFEITEPMREAVGAWIGHAGLTSESSLFPSRLHGSAHLSTRQYARIVDSWVRQLGLDTASYGTQTLRRTKATLIYRRTKNLRAVQLLLAPREHSSLANHVRRSNSAGVGRPTFRQNAANRGSFLSRRMKGSYRSKAMPGSRLLHARSSHSKALSASLRTA